MAKAFAVTENTPDYAVIHLFTNQGAAKKTLAKLQKEQKEDKNFDDDEVQIEMGSFDLTDGTAYGHKSEGSVEYGDAPERLFGERKEDAVEYSEFGAVVDLAKHKHVEIYTGRAIEVTPSKATVFIYEADEISEHVKQNKQNNTTMKHVKLFEAFTSTLNEAKVNLKKALKTLTSDGYDARLEYDMINVTDDENEYHWDGIEASVETENSNQGWSTDVTSVEDFITLMTDDELPTGEWVD